VKTSIPFTLVTLLICVILSGCGPSQAELDATSTQIAANIFATQTAQAPTATPTFTPSPTATATSTSTPTPTPTNTPTPTLTPTPGLSSVALTQDDFPVGFEAMPAEELRNLEQNYPEGASAFGFAENMDSQSVIGILFPCSPCSTQAEQTVFDKMLPLSIQSMEIALGADKNPMNLPGLDDIGEARAGITSVDKEGAHPMRWDIAVFRRSEVVMVLIVAYPDGDKPFLPIVKLARLLDERIKKFLADNWTDNPKVLFQDDFSDTSSGWDRINETEGVNDYVDDGYRIFVNKQDWYKWGNPGLNFTDVIIDVDAKKIAGPEENDYGVICRYKDEDNFYFFTIGSDGYYGVSRMSNGEESLVGMDQLEFNDTAINLGDASNHIRAKCVGDKLTLTVNGTVLADVKDANIASGDVGLIAGTYDEPGADILFDNFTVAQP